MIAFAKDSMIPGLKRLWKSCFDDPDEYIELYFRHRYRAANTLVNVSGGEPVAMLTMLPVTATSPGLEIPARYIFAVATHPDYQRKGLGSELLGRAHDWMKSQGVGLSVLAPGSAGLFDFYHRHGYKPIFQLKHVCYSPSLPYAASAERLAVFPSQLSPLLSMRDRFFGGSRLFVRWDRSALSYIDRECALLGGSTLVFKRGAMAIGYAVCYYTHDGVTAKELAVEDSDYDAAVAALQHRYCGKYLYVRLRAEESAHAHGSPKPFGMANWLEHGLEDAFKSQAGGAPYLSHALD